MLPKELSQIGKYPLLIYGNKSLKSSGNLTKIRNLLKKFKFVEFNRIKNEPDINMINEAYLLSKSKKIDSVVAIGGGSVIDASKAIALAIGNKVSPIKIFRKKIKKNALPLITIPTLPGSGSEVNGGGVIFVSGKKKEISGIFPRVSILDPKLNCNFSKSFILGGISDAMVHVAEHYFNSEEFSELLCCWAEGIFIGLIKISEKFNRYPLKPEIMGEILVATALSPKLSPVAGNGNAIWEIHPLAHLLSEYYDIPHRFAIGICFQGWLSSKEHNSSKRNKVKRFKENVLKNQFSSVANWHKSWLQRKKLPITLKYFNNNLTKKKLFIEKLQGKQKCFTKKELEKFIKTIYN